MKKILITGGAGFLGGALALELIKKGYEVTVLDNLLEQIHGENPETNSILFQKIKNKVHFIKGDVTQKNDWRKALKNQQIVVHFAAETGTGQSMYCVEKYVEVNDLGTAKMLDILVSEENYVEKVIVASSRAVYGEGKYEHPNLGVVFPENRDEKKMLSGNFEVSIFDGIPLKPIATSEDSKLHPVSLYGITKLNQERMVMKICEALGIAAVSLRYQNVYGEGQSLQNPYTGILSIFSTQILNNDELRIFEDGKETRDFVHIEDAIQATMKAIEIENSNGKIYNVGTGVSTNVIYVAESLMKNFNKNVSLTITGEFRTGDIRHNFADISKIKNELGFEPKITFEEGISRFTKWVLQQQVFENKVNSALAEMKSKGLLK